MGLWAAVNVVSYIFLVRPLTPMEKTKQNLKFKVVGKYVYGLSFLDLEQDYLEREQQGSKVSHKVETPTDKGNY